MPFYKRHGLTDTPTHRSWCSMNSRCNNSKTDQYKYYGGKGIAVCVRWETFENFLADMGLRPCGTSLDRIDNGKNYEPGNCRWATKAQQGANRSMNLSLTFRGQTKIAAEWAKEIGVDATTLRWRLKRGWSVEKALNTKVRKGIVVLQRGKVLA